MKTVLVNCGYGAVKGTGVKMKGITVALGKLLLIYKRIVALHPILAAILAVLGMPIAAVGAVFFFTFLFSIPLICNF